MNKLITFFLFGYSFASWGASPFENLTCPKSTPHFSNISIDSHNLAQNHNLACNIAEHYHQVAHEIRNWSPVLEPFHLVLTLTNTDEDFEVGNYGNVGLFVPWMYVNYKINEQRLKSGDPQLFKSKFQIYANGVFSHEYGHRIHDLWLQTDYEIIRNYYHEKDLYLALENQLKAMGDKSTLSKEDLKLYEDLWSSSFSLESSLNNLQSDELVGAISSGLYTEFFADVVALMYSENPQILYLALADFDQSGKIVKNEETKKSLARDFSQKHSALDWDGESPHNRLGEARSFFYRELLKKGPLKKIDKAKILQIVYQSMKDEFKKIESEEMSLKDSNDLINASFIKSLKNNLQKLY